MNWIRIAVGILNDPSIHMVADASGVSVPTTTGHVVGLLTYLPEHCRDGDVSGVSDATLERWAMWTGRRGKFAEAFRRYLCNEQGVVRSWDKHNGAMLREYDRQREKQKKYREEQRKNRDRTTNVPGTVGGTSSGTERNGTERTTKQQQIALPVADAPAAPALVLDAEPARPAKATKPEAKYPHFPMELCLEMHTLWVSKFGACDVSRFRGEFGPLFTVAEDQRPEGAPTNAELFAALKSYADLAPMGTGARFANVKHAAGCLAAIAITRRDLADKPDARSQAVMRIIHGRNAA